MTHEYENVMPKEEDLHGAALALIRLQDTYNLNMTEMASGKIAGSPAYVTMTGKNAFLTDNFTLTLVHSSLFKLEYVHELVDVIYRKMVIIIPDHKLMIQ